MAVYNSQVVRKVHKENWLKALEKETTAEVLYLNWLIAQVQAVGAEWIGCLFADILLQLQTS
jgi:hypothetical protein